MAATIPAPRTPAPKTALPTAAPRNGVNACAMSPTVSSEASGIRCPIVAAQATRIAAMTSWVMIAPIPVSKRSGEVFGTKSLIGNRRLLVKDHPRHDDCADIRRDQIGVGLVSERDVDAAGDERVHVRVCRPGDEEEGEFEEPDHDRRPFYPPVRSGEHNREERRSGDR